MGHCLLMVALLIGPNAFGFNKEDQRISDKRLDAFEFLGESRMWNNQFQELCFRADLPCGRASVSGDDWALMARDKAIRLRNPTVKTILDMIVSQHPEYRWFVDRGVINLVHREVLEKRIRLPSPLERRIKSLDIVDAPLDLAAFQICQQAGMNCRHAMGTAIEGDDEGLSLKSQFTYRRITLHLSNISFREALNALVRKDGHSSWGFIPDRALFEHKWWRLPNSRVARSEVFIDQWAISPSDQRGRKAQMEGAGP
jgi:hypothetical protein